VFLAEKRFVGCADLKVTDLMRVTIAAQACVLLLNRSADYFPFLREILVYPGAFVVERLHVDPLGLHNDLSRVLAGESSSRGQVVLSWDDALAGAANADDGRNVVIHEFAHQLDQEFGHANGAPQLARREDYSRWSQALADAYARLRAQLSHGLPTTLDPYAATDPAEFFAVACEHFFERPAELQRAEPALYAQLSAYFELDPTSWT
jgi:Mlc titration factor MtfA (ptsG expression regulator)